MDRFFGKKRAIVFIGLILLIGVLSAGPDSKAGEFGFQFLKLPVSAEVAGMGGTGEMLHTSPLNMMHHPVAFNWQRGSVLALSQSQWIFDTHLYNVAYRHTKFNHAIGFGMTYLDNGKFDRRDDKGDLIGNYQPMNLRFMTNYARKLTPMIHAGVNLNLLYEKIDTSSALAFTTDLGLAYLTPLRNTTMDIAFRNIGVSGKMDEEKTDIPIIIDYGLTTGFAINEFLNISPAIKLSYMQDHDDLLPAIGANLRVLDLLSLRVGYKFNYNEEDFSAGLGLTVRDFTVNYSFMNGLDNVHIFSICYAF